MPIFDTLRVNEKGKMESKSEREDRYMIVREIENKQDPNPFRWTVHPFFQKVFKQILLNTLVGISLKKT